MALNYEKLYSSEDLSGLSRLDFFKLLKHTKSVETYINIYNETGYADTNSNITLDDLAKKYYSESDYNTKQKIKEFMSRVSGNYSPAINAEQGRSAKYPLTLETMSHWTHHANIVNAVIGNECACENSLFNIVTYNGSTCKNTTVWEKIINHKNVTAKILDYIINNPLNNEVKVLAEKRKSFIGNLSFKLKQDATEAAYKTAADQVVKITSNLILSMINNSEVETSVSKILESTYGRGIVSMIAGLILANYENQSAQKIAEHLRINSMAMVGNEIVNELIESLPMLGSFEKIRVLDVKNSNINLSDDFNEEYLSNKENKIVRN